MNRDLLSSYGYQPQLPPGCTATTFVLLSILDRRDLLAPPPVLAFISLRENATDLQLSANGGESRKGGLLYLTHKVIRTFLDDESFTRFGTSWSIIYQDTVSAASQLRVIRAALRPVVQDFPGSSMGIGACKLNPNQDGLSAAWMTYEAVLESFENYAKIVVREGPGPRPDVQLAA